MVNTAQTVLIDPPEVLCCLLRIGMFGGNQEPNLSFSTQGRMTGPPPSTQCFCEFYGLEREHEKCARY